MVDRVKTGIPGLDNLMEGGFPRTFNILAAGAPGTGKTILGLQYLCTGAKNGQPGLYISLDASDGRVREQADQFGWNIEKLESEGSLSILELPIDKSRIDFFEMIEDSVKEIKAKRLVFDSLASFAINVDQFVIPLGTNDAVQALLDKLKKNKKTTDKEYKYDVMRGFEKDIRGKTFYAGTSERRITYLVLNELASLDTTNLILTDTKEGAGQFTVDGVSEYTCDGVIGLYNELIGAKRVRTLSIVKMRSTAHSPYIHDFEFGKKGITVKPAENVYK